MLTDLLDAEGEALAEELGDAAVFVHHDVSSVDDWARAVEVATSTFGKLDVLVNNAGIHSVIPIEDETFERFQSAS